MNLKMPCLVSTVLVVLSPGASCRAAEETTKPCAPSYEYRQAHDPNGTGKFYLGREIAQVMGHQAADWLERPEREQEEKPDLLVEALKLKPGDVVADIGAGTGYYSGRLAKLVGDKGLVYAVDIQQEMLDLLDRKMAGQKITNVKGVLGAITDPKLPARSGDLILMVDVYHEFSKPREMLAKLREALKPSGRLILLEYRKEDPSVPIRLEHKMTVQEVRAEIEPEGFRFEKSLETLPRQHILIFRPATAQ